MLIFILKNTLSMFMNTIIKTISTIASGINTGKSKSEGKEKFFIPPRNKDIDVP